MAALHIPHDAWVLVGDGRKALALRNEGDELYPNFKVARLFEHDNPPSHEQGSDKPGRLNDAFGNKSAVGETDWHRLEEDRFAKTVADRLYMLVHSGVVHRLVIVAPPRTLGTLRAALHPEVQKVVIAELDKDLTGHPIPAIEAALRGAEAA